MENLKKFSILWFGMCLGVSVGCAKIFPYQLSSPAEKAAEIPPNEFVSGSVKNTEGQSIDLGSFRTIPLVVVFAQDTCTTCLEETLEIRSALQNPGREPARIKMVSILVGAFLEDAQDWKTANAVPWAVTIDSDDPLFRRYCVGGKVPCTIVQVPDHGIVLRKIGVTSIAEIKKLTGDWEN